MPDSEDISLLKRCADGDEPAFTLLVERYIHLVYSTALRQVGNPSHAEEISQAVFIILTRKAKSISPKTILSGWLYQTTRLTAANFLRSESSRQQREQEAYMQSTLTEPDTGSWNEIAPLLEEAMGRLGQADRDAIVLRFFENKTPQELATMLGLNEVTARKRVSRALERLRNYFLKRGVDSTTSAIAKTISGNAVQVAPMGLAKSVTIMALAKGAGASTSTLTLIKGALKLMAWTKAKTAMVVSLTAIALTFGGGSYIYFNGIHKHFRLPIGKAAPSIALSDGYGIILASDGSLWTWGDEELGWPVLGISNINHTPFLHQIGNERDWVGIAAGGSHNLAIKSDGTIRAWGANSSYQLGDSTKMTRNTPVISVDGNDWKQVAAGGTHSVALKNAGTLWAWGNNWGGQLGIGSISNSSLAVQIGSDTNWVKVWADGIENVGLKSDGSLWFWGYQYLWFGEKGKSYPVPTRISADNNWVDAGLGDFRAFAIKSDGTLWTWGCDADIYTGGDKTQNGTPKQLGTDTDWHSCASFSSTCALFMKKDDSLWALDDVLDQRSKRLGNPAWQLQPVQFQRIDLRKNIVAFAGERHKTGVALTRDGEVWTWGGVIGEHSPSDYLAKNGRWNRPKITIRNTPWRLSITNTVE